jgi:hypothetical protein
MNPARGAETGTDTMSRISKDSLKVGTDQQGMLQAVANALAQTGMSEAEVIQHLTALSVPDNADNMDYSGSGVTQAQAVGAEDEPPEFAGKPKLCGDSSYSSGDRRTNEIRLANRQIEQAARDHELREFLRPNKLAADAIEKAVALGRKTRMAQDQARADLDNEIELFGKHIGVG